MAAKSKTSRRLVVAALVDMLEAGKSSAEVAQILAAYLVKNKCARDVELYLRDIELAIADRFSVATARVSSARALSDKTRERIKKLVNNRCPAICRPEPNRRCDYPDCRRRARRFGPHKITKFKEYINGKDFGKRIKRRIA